MTREHRRIINPNRTLSIKGASEAKNGVGRQSTRAAKYTRLFKSNSKKLIKGGPVAGVLPRTKLKEELKLDGIKIQIDQSRGIMTPVMRITNKTPSTFQKRGIVIEDQTDSGFSLSTIDTLYAYQLGLLGEPQTRKQNFKNLMDWAILNDPNFMEKYLVYMELRDNNFIVVDGYQYGATFAFLEPMPKGVIKTIKKAPPDKIGPNKEIAIMSAGLIDVPTNTMKMNELIKGQHLATKNDLRYYIANINGPRDENGHLIGTGNGISVILLKRDRLSLPFAGDNVEALIMDSPSAFEFKEDTQ